MTFTKDTEPISRRLVKTLLGIGVASCMIYFLLWGALEGYKYIGR